MISATLVDESLEPLLAWSALVLSRALEVAGDPDPPGAGLGALRGLVMSSDAIRDRLAGARREVEVIVEPPPLPDALARALERAGADLFDRAALALALAVELDPAAARAVAYLHDDMRLRRLSVDLLAALCWQAAGSWTDGIRRLAPSGTLVARGLLAVAGAGGDAEVRATADVVRFAAGAPDLDGELEAALAPALAAGDHDDGLSRWAHAPAELVLHVHGAAADVLAARVAAALRDAGRDAVRVDLAALHATAVAPLVAHCLLHDRAALLVLPRGGHPSLARLLRDIDAACVVDPALVLWQARAASDARPTASLRLAPLDVAERAEAVAAGLHARGFALAHGDSALAFARRYSHGPDGVAQVTAATAARLRARGRLEATADDVLKVAAVLAGAPLRDLATRVTRVAGWADLAVPDAVAEQLRELCLRVDIRDEVLAGRSYGETVGATRGVSAIFAGPSGAGKTLAASVIACELGLALYRVDLARVVSKYIGETERNLEAVFSAAESTDVVLLFDEADALFGRRSEVSDAHDRYANLEVAYLLQRMESYDGVAILSTNLMRNLDEAFTRRLDFRVLFPFPGERERRRIWDLMWPAGERLADDVDLDVLAGEHDLSGGMIRNAVLAAAHLAAGEQAPVSRRHLDRAVAREHDKLGRLPRLLTAAEL